MDENEKKTGGASQPEMPVPEENPIGQPEQETQPDAASGGSPQESEDSGLGAELEGLRDLLQTELDKATQQNGPLSAPVNDWENLVDTSAGPVELETPEFPGPEEARQPAIPEEDRCILCEKRERDKSRGEDYLYCGQCREAMKKRPISWAVIPLILAIVACVAFGAVSLVDETPAFRSVLTAHKALAEDRVYDSLDAYSTAFQSGVQNDKIMREMIGVFYRAGYFSDIGTMISQSYTAEDLAKYKNRSLKKINDAVGAVNNTSNAVGTILSDYADATPADIPYDDLIAQIDALADTDTTKYDPAIKEYYKYTIAIKSGKDTDVQMALLNSMKEKNPDYKWLYLSPMINCLTQQGKYDEALKMCEEQLKLNVQDGYYLADKAAVYRRMQEYDKALAVCQTGIDELTDNSELFRQQAIVLLLQGKTQEAADAANNAYEASLTVATANTLALCNLVNGDTEGYNQVNTMLKGYNLTMNSKVTDYQAGTVTLEDIFLKDGGDVV